MQDTRSKHICVCVCNRTKDKVSVRMRNEAVQRRIERILIRMVFTMKHVHQSSDRIYVWMYAEMGIFVQVGLTTVEREREKIPWILLDHKNGISSRRNKNITDENSSIRHSKWMNNNWYEVTIERHLKRTEKRAWVRVKWKNVPSQSQMNHVRRLRSSFLFVGLNVTLPMSTA